MLFSVLSIFISFPSLLRKLVADFVLIFCPGSVTSFGPEKDPKTTLSKSGYLSNKNPAVVIPPPKPSPAECRRRFLENLSTLTQVSLTNNVDDTSPPLDFLFISQSILGDGVERATEDFMTGCTCPKHCVLLHCGCLEDAATNALGQKVFPYSAGKTNSGCLRDFYLEAKTGRHHIYECNSRCNCATSCKNRLVQFGRTIPLEIFKTMNRGWGKWMFFLFFSFFSRFSQ